MTEGAEQEPALRPPTATVPQALPHLKSRWYAGASTFGPGGRVVATGVVIGIPLIVLAWGVLTTGVIGLMILGPFVFIWCFTGGRLALTDIWARDTYYVPVPVVPEAKQLIGHDGRRIPTMEEYVASQAVPPPPPGE